MNSFVKKLNVKKGDKVIACFHSVVSSTEEVAIVERVTPTGLIRVDGRLYYPTGCCRNNDHYYLKECSKEEELRVIKKNFVSNMMAKLHQLEQLSYEQAVAIDKILTDSKGEGENERN